MVDLYQKIILKHGIKPLNRKQPKQFEASFRIDNNYCGDWIEIFLSGDQSNLKEHCFWNKSCVLLQASASILMDLLNQKDVSEFFTWKKQLEILLSNEFLKSPQAIEGSQTESSTQENQELQLMESPLHLLPKSIHIFKAFSQTPTRRKCILLPWEALAQTLKKLPKKR